MFRTSAHRHFPSILLLPTITVAYCETAHYSKLLQMWTPVTRGLPGHEPSHPRALFGLGNCPQPCPTPRPKSSRAERSKRHAERTSSEGPMLIMIINSVRTSQTGPAHHSLASCLELNYMAAPTVQKLKLIRPAIITLSRCKARKSVAENLVRMLVFHRLDSANTVHVAALYNLKLW